MIKYGDRSLELRSTVQEIIFFISTWAYSDYGERDFGYYHAWAFDALRRYIDGDRGIF